MPQQRESIAHLGRGESGGIVDSLPWPTTATEGCERENRNIQKPELKPGMEGGTRNAARRICWLQGDVKRERRHNKYKLHLILTSTIAM